MRVQLCTLFFFPHHIGAIVKSQIICAWAGAGTTEQKLLCPERSKVFWNESEMLVHILNHPEQEQCSCELCEEKFDYEGQLFEHLITHMEACGIAFSCVVLPWACYQLDKKKLEEKTLLIEDENCKKGIGLISPCVPNIDHQLVDDNEELEALVTKSRISNQVKGISINVLDKSSIEKDNGSQNYLTNVKDELSLEIDNAFKEGKHDEPYFTKADVKDF
ncbi:hypothetical protein JTE90_022865 [Oedothorax gibbosus]|uniref:C2H2-type domain-containing protein n=1 Tax=Oedothorax gibbosus TaxID=931172 RepID=A0AAV6TI44_9ARAC|nr:hypothetical protein JTE90_022865 [Oedothorax gibbosus]